MNTVTQQEIGCEGNLYTRPLKATRYDMFLEGILAPEDVRRVVHGTDKNEP